MALVNAFRDFMALAATGGAVTAFNTANAHICVGNGTAAFAATQTDLQGASKARKAMDATYPQVAGGVMTFRSTFGTADANFAWEELAVANASAAGTIMNREVENNGTKATSETKQVTYTITLAV